MNPNPDRPLTESERFPLLHERGRAMLQRLLEHPHAPKYTFPCGDRLDAAGLERVQAFRRHLDQNRSWMQSLAEPPWLSAWIKRCVELVPFYRARTCSGITLAEIPTCSRADLMRAPWSFVPDDQSLDDLIVYFTSGTTGSRLFVYSHPVVSSAYLAGLEWLLAQEGIELARGPEHVAIVQVCAQQSTYTHATVASYLDQAGYAKINLNPHDWRDPDDRWRFLEDCRPQVLTGDPVAFLALAASPAQVQPRALVSSAMLLLPETRAVLTRRFGCPVFDTYSLNEARLVAGAKDGRSLPLLAPDLCVEILDPAGQRCPEGVRGEITLTGGRNPFLPLLRYRTGDYAALGFGQKGIELREFEGRAPVVFLDDAGRAVNSIDVTGALRAFPLAQCVVHQLADRSLIVKVRGLGWTEEELRRVLAGVFGKGTPVTIATLSEAETTDGKVLPYKCDVKEMISGRELPNFRWQNTE
ncbi:MAG TPA: capsule biosynthesis protein CapK [Candidatus Ozemobacteraceae bacterium]|nr:capsule biosynthesis protein CapK [Candidatus Ozemobacteraceae bacterium]